MIAEKPCLARFARDQDNIVSTNVSRLGLGITLWQKQNDHTIRPIAFGSRYLDKAEKNCSIGELELLAVEWGIERFCFPLYGKLAYLYTDDQTLETLIKRNRAYQQNSARLMRRLDRLAHFAISKKTYGRKESSFDGQTKQTVYRRSNDRANRRCRICNQNSLRTFRIKPYIRSTVEQGLEISINRPIGKHDFRDETREYSMKLLHRSNSIRTEFQEISRANNPKQTIQAAQTLMPLLNITILILRVRKWKI